MKKSRSYKIDTKKKGTNRTSIPEKHRASYPDTLITSGSTIHASFIVILTHRLWWRPFRCCYSVTVHYQCQCGNSPAINHAFDINNYFTGQCYYWCAVLVLSMTTTHPILRCWCFVSFRSCQRHVNNMILLQLVFIDEYFVSNIKLRILIDRSSHLTSDDWTLHYSFDLIISYNACSLLTVRFSSLIIPLGALRVYPINWY